MSVKFSPNGFLDIASDPSELPAEGMDKDEISGAMRRCTNLHLDKAGIASTRKGSSKINASAVDQTGPHLLIEQAGDRYFFAGTKIYRNEAAIGTGLADVQWYAIKYNAFNSLVENIFALNGVDLKRISGATINLWGLDPPGIAARIRTGYQTGLSGTYNAKYTYVRKEGSAVVCESDPSQAASASVSLTNQSLVVLCEPPTDSQVTHIRLYRTDTAGVTYYYDQELTFLGPNDYAYCFDWEESNAHLAGTGFKITTSTEVLSTNVTEIHDCDALSDNVGVWSVVSGDGVIMSLDTSTQSEGTGSIKLVIPKGITAIVKFTKNTGVWDLSNYRTLGMSIVASRDLTSKDASYTMFMGEAAYSEQTSGLFSPGNPSGLVWEEHAWDISGIANASKNAITQFGFSVANPFGLKTLIVWIDNVKPYASPSGYDKLYEWEVYGTANTELIKSGYDWEPVGVDTNTADTSLGVEVATDHDRPPLGTFLFGPSLNGTCFILKENLLHYSLPKQPEYWPVNYYLEISPIQFPLKAGLIHDGQVYVATTDEIYLIAGSGHNSWSPPLAQSAICGTVAPRCFLGVRGLGIFHLGNDGLYLYSGAKDESLTNSRFRPLFEGTAVGSLPGINKTNIANCWLIQFKNKLYFGYPETGSTYPDNIVVTDLATMKTVHYDYSGKTFPVVGIDYQNDKLMAVDTSGFIWEIEDSDITTDGGTAISWQIETKEYSDQLRKYFPRHARYDVNLGTGATATGAILLNGTSKQTHTLTESRQTRKRLVTGCNGDRIALRITGTGPVDIYAAEVD